MQGELQADMEGPNKRARVLAMESSRTTVRAPPPLAMQPQEWKTWGSGHLVRRNTERGYTCVKCNHFATSTAAKRAMAKVPCGKGSKPGKCSP
eukprot:15581360-Heterocapsa_arctica.AAC.1